MQLKTLLTDETDRGVSPVIGVILMVAITVILAAVIGAFVLGLGDQVSNNAPQASFEYEFNGTYGVDITHGGGDDITKSELSINANGSTYNASSWVSGDTIQTGDVININQTTLDDNGASTAFSSGDTIRVIWQNPSGGSSNTLSERDFP